MAGSLFDQLKKAGLVDEKKAKKAKQQKYQQSKQKKGKKGQTTQNDTLIASKQAQQKKAEHDRQLNLERQQQRQQKAEKAALQQLINAHKLTGFDGDHTFNFVDNGKVKTLHTNRDTQQLLADGRVRVARISSGYALLPKAISEKVLQRNAAALIPLADVDDKLLSKEDQEHYAQYEVPDDLTW